MSYYVMRNVRCKSCCKVIAHLVDPYKALMDNGYSMGDALTFLGITRYCCRKEMMCPFRIRFSMENRQVIEGSITVSEIPIKLQGERVPNHPLIKVPSKKFEMSSGKAENNNFQNTKNNEKEEEDFFDDIFDEDIDLEIEERELIEPNYIGVPTYNNSDFSDVYIRVGDGYEVKVIGGRTFLAN